VQLNDDMRDSQGLLTNQGLPEKAKWHETNQGLPEKAKQKTWETNQARTTPGQIHVMKWETIQGLVAKSQHWY